ncbi:MAG: HEPN domain-containing protein [Desulfamplus sp.]|nr:HEPN domain-containing protein [Desulfamplus sp.]
MELQVVLNTYATDIFRNQADYDYISARANFRMQLRQQFLWASQQSVEKYLKAILLFNGKSARYYQKAGETKQTEFGHNLEALNNEVTKLSFLGYGLNDKDKSFLIYLNKQGGANRYLSTSAYNTPDVLQELDRLVWNVRRYCQYIPDRCLGCKDVVPEMKEAVIRSINDPIHERQPHKFSISSGKLEEIVNREPRDQARSTLVWANLFYGKKQRHKMTYNTFSSTDIPPNERGWNGVDWKIIEKYIKP